MSLNVPVFAVKVFHLCMNFAVNVRWYDLCMKIDYLCVTFAWKFSLLLLSGC